MNENILNKIREVLPKSFVLLEARTTGGDEPATTLTIVSAETHRNMAARAQVEAEAETPVEPEEITYEPAPKEERTPPEQPAASPRQGGDGEQETSYADETETDPDKVVDSNADVAPDPSMFTFQPTELPDHAIDEDAVE